MTYKSTWKQKWVRAPHLGEAKPPKEIHEQIRLAQYLDRINVLWNHVPNGGERPKGAEIGMLKASGVKKGVPDNLIYQAPPRWPIEVRLKSQPLCRLEPSLERFPRPVGVAIELKRLGATPSLVSPEQTAWGEELMKRGWYWFVARGCDEAIDEMIRMGYSDF